MNNSDQITFSLILPFYKVELYIRDCLESCIRQTYPHIEIICIDDASPDNSVQVVRDLMQKDSRIRLLSHEKNRGLGGARNTGLAAASGDYIWFIDSDDTIAIDACELLERKIRQYNFPDIVCPDYAKMECETGEIVESNLLGLKEEYTDTHIIERAVSINLLCAWLKICRRTLIANYRFIENVTAEDINSFSWFFDAKSVLTLSDAPYRYKIHRPGSITAVNDISFSSDVVHNTYLFLIETLENPNLNQEEREAVLHFFSRRITTTDSHFPRLWKYSSTEEKKRYLDEARMILFYSRIVPAAASAKRQDAQTVPAYTIGCINKALDQTAAAAIKNKLRSVKRSVKRKLKRLYVLFRDSFAR